MLLYNYTFKEYWVIEEYIGIYYKLYKLYNFIIYIFNYLNKMIGTGLIILIYFKAITQIYLFTAYVMVALSRVGYKQYSKVHVCQAFPFTYD